jgi:hypothetical protein
LTKLEELTIDSSERAPSDHNEFYQFLNDNCVYLRKLRVRPDDAENAEKFFSGSDIVVERYSSEAFALYW